MAKYGTHHFLCFRVIRVLVWMKLERQLPVFLLDLLVRGRLRDIQQLVQALAASSEKNQARLRSSLRMTQRSNLVRLTGNTNFGTVQSEELGCQFRWLHLILVYTNISMASLQTHCSK